MLRSTKDLYIRKVLINDMNRKEYAEAIEKRKEKYKKAEGKHKIYRSVLMEALSEHEGSRWEMDENKDIFVGKDGTRVELFVI
jgi:hypothetical protein